MDTQIKDSDAQGANDPNLQNIEKWLDQDLSRLLSLINAMYQDKELKKLLVTWFHGRIQNHKQKEVVKNQTELFSNGQPV